MAIEPTPCETITPIIDAWYLTGPTACGKSTVGIELARLLDAEIISLDSMALYRRMNLATAKPTLEQRRQVPHHLMDVVNPDQEFSLVQYVDAAHEAVREIRKRGRQPLFVGGTPLYLKALLRGVFRGPDADWEYREQLTSRAARDGLASLHGELSEIDSEAAERIHPNDQRRIIRALEVFHATGQPITFFQRQFEQAAPAETRRVFALDRPREVLYQRIEQRVEQMFNNGLVKEVQQINSQFETWSRTASKALGYAEVLDHLAGQHNLADTIELIQRNTRRFAKRQGTWFRSLSECRPVVINEADAVAELAKRIAQAGHEVSF